MKDVDVSHCFKQTAEYDKRISRFNTVVNFPWREDQNAVIEKFMENKNKYYVINGIFGCGKTTLLFGLLIISIGTGGSMLSVLYLDTGIASLIIGFEPLLLIFLMWLLKNDRPGFRKSIGVFIGILGMYFLFNQNQITENNNEENSGHFQICNQTLQCGHQCKGVAGESNCLPCINFDCIEAAQEQDLSD